MGGKRRLGSTARCADQLGPTAPCSSAAGWTAASSARSARACTGAGHPPSLACLLASAAPSSRFVEVPREKGRMQAARISVSHIQGDQLQTCRALCWDGRRREGLLRRGLGGREHRNQPQVRRPRRHEPTRSTAHTHAHTRTHARARTHAHAHHTPNARTGRATCCSSTSDA